MYRIILSAVGIVCGTTFCGATEVAASIRDGYYSTGNVPHAVLLKLTPNETLDFRPKGEPETSVSFADGGKYEYRQWNQLQYAENLKTPNTFEQKRWKFEYNRTLFVLTGLSFKKSGIFECNFANVFFEKTDFTDADLRGTALAVNKECLFTNASIAPGRISTEDDDENQDNVFEGRGIRIIRMTADQLKSTKSYKDKQLAKCTFSLCYFSETDFSNCDLTGTKFVPPEGTNQVIYGYGLGYAFGNDDAAERAKYKNKEDKEWQEQLRISNELWKCNFTGANLRETVFDAAAVQNSDFTKADLRHARFLPPARKDERAMFVQNIRGCNFTDALIDGATFYGLSRQQLESTASFKKKRLVGCTFCGCDFRGVNLTDFNLSDTVFKANEHLRQYSGDLDNRTNLTDADFTNAVITGCTFYHSVEKDNIWSSFRNESKPFYYTKDNPPSYAVPPPQGLTAAQIQSTWNGKNNRLAGINLPPEIEKVLKQDKQTGEKP